MDARKRDKVLDFLRAQPWPGDFKRQVLAGWAKVTGAVVALADANSVGNSGWDSVRR